jgi:ribosome-associated toxin RatA of RatAB toxin-antitoxin module
MEVKEEAQQKILSSTLLLSNSYKCQSVVHHKMTKIMAKTVISHLVLSFQRIITKIYSNELIVYIFP